MNHRERIMTVLKLEEPDRVPYFDYFDVESVIKMGRLFQDDVPELKYDIDYSLDEVYRLYEVQFSFMKELDLDAMYQGFSSGEERIPGSNDLMKNRYGIVYQMSPHGEPFAVDGPVHDPSDLKSLPTLGDRYRHPGSFRRNMRVAIVGNSDDFRGRPGAFYPASDWAGGYGGLTGIFAEKLDRDSIWKAIKARHCYATSGARIFLQVLMNEALPMGRVINHSRAQTLSVRVAGTAPVERIEVRNGIEVVQTIRPYTADDLGHRIKIIWNGAASRGRGRKFKWDGNLRILGNLIRNHALVNFYGMQRERFKRDGNQAEWESTTTGGNAGVILELEEKAEGTLEVTTENVAFQIPIEDIGFKTKKYPAKKGIDAWMSIYRLPEKGVSDYQFSWKVKALKKGDNPLYVYVVQEAGHRAWSSPIYVVGK